MYSHKIMESAESLLVSGGYPNLELAIHKALMLKMERTFSTLVWYTYILDDLVHCIYLDEESSKGL